MELSLNFLIISLMGMATFYFGKVYNFLFWSCRVTKQDVEKIITISNGCVKTIIYIEILSGRR